MSGEHSPFASRRATPSPACSSLRSPPLSLYVVLVSELDRSTDEFLKDKVNVVRTMLREQPEDIEGLHEEVELESASRRYEQFYISLLDEHGRSQLMTPGMADQLDLPRLASRLAAAHGASGLTIHGRHGRSFRVIQTAVATDDPIRPPRHHPGSRRYLR